METLTIWAWLVNECVKHQMICDGELRIHESGGIHAGRLDNIWDLSVI
jgi:hypothetical protein